MGQIEVGECLSDRPQRRVVRGAGALPASAVVHGQTAAVNERALGEVGDVRVAPTIEVCEEPGEHPQDEVGRQMKSRFPLAALEPGQPLSGGTTNALSALCTLPRCHALTPSLSRAVVVAISAWTGPPYAILFADAAPREEIGGSASTTLTSPPDRFLFIVSRGNTKLASYLQNHFTGDATVQVVVDRRHGERRQQTTDMATDRRRGDRRSRPHVDKELRLTSFAIVTLSDSAAL